MLFKMDFFHLMQVFFLVVWLTICAAQDARQRNIANVLTLGAAVLALGYILWAGTTWLGYAAAQGGWGFAVALAFTLPGYIMGKMGAGDVKLLCAIGLMTDPLHVLGCLIGAGVAGVLWIFLAPLIWPHMPQWVTAHVFYLKPEKSEKQPYAPFVLIGMLMTLFWIH